jgi:4-amino-4-deoxy-L-arabinose transferase-like glycosyltransferase
MAVARVWRQVSPTRFRLALAGIALLALAVRLTYGFAADVPEGFGDDLWYHEVANSLVDGRGFSDPFNSAGPDGTVVFGDSGEPLPTAFHLPLFPAVLALGSLVGAGSYDAHLALGCGFGAASAIVIGLVGRRVGGERLGLIAAALAAVHLPLVANDALLMSESLYGLLIALTVLAALAYHHDPRRRSALLLGLALGAACLTRGEALLLVLLLAVPLTLLRRRRWADLAVVILTVAACVLPWSLRNSFTFDEPVLLTTGEGSVVGGANLDSTYYGHLLGAWDFEGLFAGDAGQRRERNEAVQSRLWRREGIEYARAHAERLPAVAAYRLMRTWSLYPFAPQAKVDFAGVNYKHITSVEWFSLLNFLVVVCLALPGLATLRRRGVPLPPFVAPLVLVSVASVLAYGDLRFRQAAEVALVLLAAVSLERLLPGGVRPLESPRLKGSDP